MKTSNQLLILAAAVFLGTAALAQIPAIPLPSQPPVQLPGQPHPPTNAVTLTNTGGPFLVTNYVWQVVERYSTPPYQIAAPPEAPDPGRLLPFKYGDLIAAIVSALVAAFMVWLKQKDKVVSQAVQETLVGHIEDAKSIIKKNVGPEAEEAFVETIKNDQRDAGVRTEVLKVYKPGKVEE